MQSTLVTLQGKGSNPKSTLYVGGLEESINEAILHSAFIAFGEIKDVNIPLDNTTGELQAATPRSLGPQASEAAHNLGVCAGKHRGFGFVEYEDKADATDAIDNMHNAELYGRVLRVNYAQPMKIKGGDKGWSHQPVRFPGLYEAQQETSWHLSEIACCACTPGFAGLRSWESLLLACWHQVMAEYLACVQVWADADDWFERQTAEEQLDKLDEEQRQKRQQELKDKHTPRDAMQPQDAMQALEATAG